MRLDLLCEVFYAAVPSPKHLCLLFRWGENRLHRLLQPVPLGGLCGKLGAASCCQRVEACLSTILRYAPLCADDAAVFEPLQGQVQRAMIYKEDFLGLVLNDPRNPLSLAVAEQ